MTRVEEREWGEDWGMTGHRQGLLFYIGLTAITHPSGNLESIVPAARHLELGRRGMQALGPPAAIDGLIPSGRTRCWSPSSGPEELLTS